MYLIKHHVFKMLNLQQVSKGRNNNLRVSVAVEVGHLRTVGQQS